MGTVVTVTHLGLAKKINVYVSVVCIFFDCCLMSAHIDQVQVWFWSGLFQVMFWHGSYHGSGMVQVKLWRGSGWVLVCLRHGAGMVQVGFMIGSCMVHIWFMLIHISSHMVHAFLRNSLGKQLSRLSQECPWVCAPATGAHRSREQ